MSPPFLLVSSSQILAPSSACLPLAASGPVSDIEKPILIGSPPCASAAPAVIAATATPARARDISLRNICFPPTRLFLARILRDLPHGARGWWRWGVGCPRLPTSNPFNH